MAQGQDITERINAEQEILESEARLREIIDSAPFGAYTYELRPDGSLVMISANLSADRIMGYPNQSLIGKTIQEAFPPLANTEIPELYYRVASQGVNLHLEKFTYHNQENSFEYEVHAIQTGKNRVTAFFMDITERLKAEEAIKQLNEELEYRVAERTIQLELAIGNWKPFPIRFHTTYARLSEESTVGAKPWLKIMRKTLMSRPEDISIESEVKPTV
jgi:PAS domain S-box-containing protein